MSMEGTKLLPPLTFVAGGSITANTLVTLHTTAGQVVECGVGGFPIGVVYDAYSSGETVPVYPLPGLHRVIASAAIVAGDNLKPAANGEIAPEASVGTNTVDTCGQAVGAASSGTFLAVLR